MHDLPRDTMNCWRVQEHVGEETSDGTCSACEGPWSAPDKAGSPDARVPWMLIGGAVLAAVVLLLAAAG